MTNSCIIAFVFDFTTWVQATTVDFQGWKGQRNGDLLRLAEQEFDAFVTVDRGIEFQQNRQQSKLILIVVFKTNRYADVKPLVPVIEAALATAQPGQFIRVPSLQS